jgi:hypothetical protein
MFTRFTISEAFQEPWMPMIIVEMFCNLRGQSYQDQSKTDDYRLEVLPFPMIRLVVHRCCRSHLKLALPCPTLLCLASPCIVALLCLALPFFALLSCFALPCLAWVYPALPGFALLCVALLVLALPCFALLWLALPCFALLRLALPCVVLLCLALLCLA